MIIIRDLGHLEEIDNTGKIRGGGSYDYSHVTPPPPKPTCKFILFDTHPEKLPCTPSQQP